MRAASALSTHPIAATALGETAGQVLEALGGARPSLVLVAVTPPHLGTLEDVGRALRVLLAPDVVIGAVASAVVGSGRHVEGGPALSLFAIAGVDAAALSLGPEPSGGLVRRGELGRATAAVVLADPSSCPEAVLVQALGDLPAAGGLVAAPWGSGDPARRGPRGPGGSRLLLDEEVRTEGAVGALLGPPARVLLSLGGTPTGEPWVVTRSAGDLVLELGGRPAVERRSEAFGDDEPTGALGILVDDHADEAGRRQLRSTAIIAVGPGGSLRLTQPIAVGRVVRFLRTGPVDVEADLASALTPLAGQGSLPAKASQGAASVLLFPSFGRSGDADLASALLAGPVAGVGVSAPLAPVGGALGLHEDGATGLVLFP